jgi:hypothetical protein
MCQIFIPEILFLTVVIGLSLFYGFYFGTMFIMFEIIKFMTTDYSQMQLVVLIIVIWLLIRFIKKGYFEPIVNVNVCANMNDAIINIEGH